MRIITGVVDHIAIFVRHVDGIAPVRLNSDAGYSVRHIEIGTLREHTAADAVEVFVGSLTVGIVMIGVVFDAVSGIISIIIGVVVNGSNGRNLPASHHLVRRVVHRAVVVVIGQLHLVVVVVVAVGIHVGTR